MSRTAIKINLSPAEQALFQTLLRRRSIPEFQKERVQIVLAAGSGLRNKDIAEQYQLEVNRVGIWRKRWGIAHQQPHRKNRDRNRQNWRKPKSG